MKTSKNSFGLALAAAGCCIALMGCSPKELDMREERKANACLSGLVGVMDLIRRVGHTAPPAQVESYEEALQKMRATLYTKYAVMTDELRKSMSQRDREGLKTIRRHLDDRKTCDASGGVPYEAPDDWEFVGWKTKRQEARAKETAEIREKSLAAWDQTIRDEAAERRKRLEQASRSVRTTNSHGVRVDHYMLKKGGVIACTTTVTGNSPAMFKCDGDV